MQDKGENIKIFKSGTATSRTIWRLPEAISKPKENLQRIKIEAENREGLQEMKYPYRSLSTAKQLPFKQ